MEFTSTVYSLIPPVLALLMVIITRRVLISLGLGIIVGALMLNGFNVAESGKQLFTIVRDIFITYNADAGKWELSTWNFYILLFLLLLGMMTSFIAISGGSRAFGEWAMRRVKTRVGAQFLTIILGIVVFIDDYFNSLAVGNVSRPLTDRYKISRAKLAYYIDSTAAPICVISPVSSWGAYIIGMIGTILAAQQITEYGSLEAFITMIPMNLYALLAIAMVFVTAKLNINLGSMKVHEKRAIEKGELIDPEKGAAPGAHSDLPESEHGKVGDLVWPIVALVVGTVGSMFWTGLAALEESNAEVTLLGIFENTAVSDSLLYGGILGLVVAIAFFFTKGIGIGVLGTGIWKGIQSMLPAIYILIFAWTINTIISEIDTGGYLAAKFEEVNIDVAWLPVLLFIISAFMAFATGTSWGTFGIMMPIAGQIVAIAEPSLVLPSLAAVLAGSVMGDHCSPISDTTILSSTGAGSNHIDHVMTQLPYAILIGAITSLGYVALGFTGNLFLTLAITAVLFIGVIFVLNKNKALKVEESK